MDLQVVVTVGGTEVEEDGEKRRKQDKTGENVKEDRGREERRGSVLIRTSTMEVLQTRTIIQTPRGFDHITPEGDTGWLRGNNMEKEKRFPCVHSALTCSAIATIPPLRWSQPPAPGT